MPHKLRQFSGKQLISVFKKFGYEIKSQSGSHIKMKRENSRNILIPNHSNIAKGTLTAIYNQALAVIPEQELKSLFYTE